VKTSYHFKNGATPKSQTSRNLNNITMKIKESFLLLGFFLLISTLSFGQTKEKEVTQAEQFSSQAGL